MKKKIFTPLENPFGKFLVIVQSPDSVHSLPANYGTLEGAQQKADYCNAQVDKEDWEELNRALSIAGCDSADCMLDFVQDAAKHL